MNNKNDKESINIKKRSFMQNFLNCIYEEKQNKDYFELVFLCIGTDRLIGDSFGPLVGTRLKELFEKYNICNINIYGTLNENICYTNVDKWIKIINKNHPGACIVVIDAALSKETNTPSVLNYKQKKNSFSLSQIISKKDQLLSYLIMFFQIIIFSKGKLNAMCIQFALFFIFSIIYQWKLFLNLSIKLISMITQKTMLQTIMF